MIQTDAIKFGNSLISLRLHLILKYYNLRGYQNLSQWLTSQLGMQPWRAPEQLFPGSCPDCQHRPNVNVAHPMSITNVVYSKENKVVRKVLKFSGNDKFKRRNVLLMRTTKEKDEIRSKGSIFVSANYK